jgi:hypothetical protein
MITENMTQDSNVIEQGRWKQRKYNDGKPTYIYNDANDVKVYSFS